MKATGQSSVVDTGAVTDGAYIPVPSGFAQSECKWMAQLASDYQGNTPSTYGGGYAFADATGRVTCQYRDNGVWRVAGFCSYVISCSH